MEAYIQLSEDQWKYILDNRLIIPINCHYINEYGLHSLIVKERELKQLMEHISDNDNIIRPTLQKAGKNMFGW